MSARATASRIRSAWSLSPGEDSHLWAGGERIERDRGVSLFGDVDVDEVDRECLLAAEHELEKGLGESFVGAGHLSAGRAASGSKRRQGFGFGDARSLKP